MALTTHIHCPDCDLPAEVSSVITLLEGGSASASVHADCSCGVRDVVLEEAKKPAKKKAPKRPAKKAAAKAPAKAAAKPVKATAKKAPAKKASKK